MRPTGHLAADGDVLVLRRTFSAPPEHVWASVTESARLARWFGTWTGDPATGAVMVTMNAEPEPVPPTRYDIHACEPPRLLVLSATDDYGYWHLTVEITHVDGATTLELRQQITDPGTVADVGPGWEWYLDRLAAAVGGDEPPTLDAFEHDYQPLSTAYAAMVDAAT